MEERREEMREMREGDGIPVEKRSFPHRLASTSLFTDTSMHYIG
jgi:hypothetical protein